MSAAEKVEAMVRDLNDALSDAVQNPSPENLREVSKLIAALHTLQEAALRERLENDAP